MKCLARIPSTLRSLLENRSNFGLFLICLCLGTAMAFAGSFAMKAIHASAEHDAKSLLGGDLEIQQLQHPVDATVTAYIYFNGGIFSRTADMPAQAKSKKPDTGKRIQVEMKGVDAKYPLYGKLATYSKIHRKNIFFSNWRGRIHGAAVDQGLLDALHIKLNDLFTIGKSTFRVTATIKHEPDRGIGNSPPKLRVMTNMAAFKSTGLTRHSKTVRYRYHIRLPEGVDASQWKARMLKQFPDASWTIRDWQTSRPSLIQQIGHLLGRISFPFHD